MLEGVVSDVLERVLGDYVQSLDRKALKVAVWKGTVRLTDLVLRDSCLAAIDPSFTVARGEVDEISISVPWKHLRKKPLQVAVRGVNILVSTTDAVHEVQDVEAELRRLASQKRDRLKQFLREELRRKAARSGESLKARLVTKLVDNLQIDIERFHVRFEEHGSESFRAPLAAGVALESIRAHTVNAQLEPTMTFDKDVLYKKVEVSGLCSYVEASPYAFVQDERDDWRGAMERALDDVRSGADPTRTDVDVAVTDAVLRPCSLTGVLTIRKKPQSTESHVEIGLETDAVALSLSRAQYAAALELSDVLAAAYMLRQERLEHRPRTRPRGREAAFAWWRYAVRCVQTALHGAERAPTRLLDAWRRTKAYIELLVEELSADSIPAESATQLAHIESQASASIPWLAACREVAVAEVQRRGRRVRPRAAERCGAFTADPAAAAAAASAERGIFTRLRRRLRRRHRASAGEDDDGAGYLSEGVTDGEDAVLSDGEETDVDASAAAAAAAAATGEPSEEERALYDVIGYKPSAKDSSSAQSSIYVLAPYELRVRATVSAARAAVSLRTSSDAPLLAALLTRASVSAWRGENATAREIGIRVDDARVSSPFFRAFQPLVLSSVAPREKGDAPLVDVTVRRDRLRTTVGGTVAPILVALETAVVAEMAAFARSDGFHLGGARAANKLRSAASSVRARAAARIFDIARPRARGAAPTARRIALNLNAVEVQMFAIDSSTGHALAVAAESLSLADALRTRRGCDSVQLEASATKIWATDLGDAGEDLLAVAARGRSGKAYGMLAQLERPAVTVHAIAAGAGRDDEVPLLAVDADALGITVHADAAALALAVGCAQASATAVQSRRPSTGERGAGAVVSAARARAGAAAGSASGARLPGRAGTAAAAAAARAATGVERILFATSIRASSAVVLLVSDGAIATPENGGPFASLHMTDMAASASAAAAWWRVEVKADAAELRDTGEFASSIRAPPAVLGSARVTVGRFAEDARDFRGFEREIHAAMGSAEVHLGAHLATSLRTWADECSAVVRQVRGDAGPEEQSGDGAADTPSSADDEAAATRESYTSAEVSFDGAVIVLYDERDGEATSAARTRREAVDASGEVVAAQEGVEDDEEADDDDEDDQFLAAIRAGDEDGAAAALESRGTARSSASKARSVPRGTQARRRFVDDAESFPTVVASAAARVELGPGTATLQGAGAHEFHVAGRFSTLRALDPASSSESGPVVVYETARSGRRGGALLLGGGKSGEAPPTVSFQVSRAAASPLVEASAFLQRSTVYLAHTFLAALRRVSAQLSASVRREGRFSTSGARAETPFALTITQDASSVALAGTRGDGALLVLDAGRVVATARSNEPLEVVCHRVSGRIERRAGGADSDAVGDESGPAVGASDVLDETDAISVVLSPRSTEVRVPPLTLDGTDARNTAVVADVLMALVAASRAPEALPGGAGPTWLGLDDKDDADAETGDGADAPLRSFVMEIEGVTMELASRTRVRVSDVRIASEQARAAHGGSGLSVDIGNVGVLAGRTDVVRAVRRGGSASLHLMRGGGEIEVVMDAWRVAVPARRADRIALASLAAAVIGVWRAHPLGAPNPGAPRSSIRIAAPHTVLSLGGTLRVHGSVVVKRDAGGAYAVHASGLSVSHRRVMVVEPSSLSVNAAIVYDGAAREVEVQIEESSVRVAVDAATAFARATARAARRLRASASDFRTSMAAYWTSCDPSLLTEAMRRRTPDPPRALLTLSADTATVEIAVATPAAAGEHAASAGEKSVAASGGSHISGTGVGVARFHIARTSMRGHAGGGAIAVSGTTTLAADAGSATRGAWEPLIEPLKCEAAVAITPVAVEVRIDTVSAALLNVTESLAPVAALLRSARSATHRATPENGDDAVAAAGDDDSGSDTDDGSSLPAAKQRTRTEAYAGVDALAGARDYIASDGESDSEGGDSEGDGSGGESDDGDDSARAWGGEHDESGRRAGTGFDGGQRGNAQRRGAATTTLHVRNFTGSDVNVGVYRRGVARDADPISAASLGAGERSVVEVAALSAAALSVEVFLPALPGAESRRVDLSAAGRHRIAVHADSGALDALPAPALRRLRRSAGAIIEVSVAADGSRTIALHCARSIRNDSGDALEICLVPPAPRSRMRKSDGAEADAEADAVITEHGATGALMVAPGATAPIPLERLAAAGDGGLDVLVRPAVATTVPVADGSRFSRVAWPWTRVGGLDGSSVVVRGRRQRRDVGDERRVIALRAPEGAPVGGASVCVRCRGDALVFQPALVVENALPFAVEITLRSREQSKGITLDLPRGCASAPLAGLCAGAGDVELGVDAGRVGATTSALVIPNAELDRSGRIEVLGELIPPVGARASHARIPVRMEIHEPRGAPRTATLFVRFWIMNRAHKALRFRPAEFLPLSDEAGAHLDAVVTAGRMPAVAPGCQLLQDPYVWAQRDDEDDGIAARDSSAADSAELDDEDLMVAFDDGASDAAHSRIEVRVPDGSWSSAVPVGAAGSSGRVEAEVSDDGNAANEAVREAESRVTLGVHVRAASAPFQRTRVVTVTPRVVVVNALDLPVEIAPSSHARGDAEAPFVAQIPAGAACAVHWASASAAVRLSSELWSDMAVGKWRWSSPWHLETAGVSTLRIRNTEAVTSVFLRGEISLRGGTLVAVLRSGSGPRVPFRIVNDLDVNLVLWQGKELPEGSDGVDKPVAIAPPAPFLRDAVGAYAEIEYAWDDPAGSPTLCIAVPRRDSEDNDAEDGYDAAEKQRLDEDARRMFGDNPERAVLYLMQQGQLERDPVSVARWLLTTPGLPKARVGEYLSQSSDFNERVLQAYVAELAFADMDFEGALRYFLSLFRLPDEAQQIDRVLLQFAARFCEENAAVFANADQAYTLAYATLLLNTDAHHPLVKDKMSKASFVRNVLEAPAVVGDSDSEGPFPSREYLEQLYDRIVAQSLVPKIGGVRGEVSGNADEADVEVSNGATVAQLPLEQMLGTVPRYGLFFTAELDGATRVLRISREDPRSFAMRASARRSAAVKRAFAAAKRVAIEARVEPAEESGPRNRRSILKRVRSAAADIAVGLRASTESEQMEALTALEHLVATRGRFLARRHKLKAAVWKRVADPLAEALDRHSSARVVRRVLAFVLAAVRTLPTGALLPLARALLPPLLKRLEDSDSAVAHQVHRAARALAIVAHHDTLLVQAIIDLTGKASTEYARRCACEYLDEVLQRQATKLRHKLERTAIHQVVRRTARHTHRAAADVQKNATSVTFADLGLESADGAPDERGSEGEEDVGAAFAAELEDEAPGILHNSDDEQGGSDADDGGDTAGDTEAGTPLRDMFSGVGSGAGDEEDEDAYIEVDEQELGDDDVDGGKDDDSEVGRDSVYSGADTDVEDAEERGALAAAEADAELDEAAAEIAVGDAAPVHRALTVEFRVRELGVSVVDKGPRELLFATLRDVVLRSADRGDEIDMEVSAGDLQVDCQLPPPLYFKTVVHRARSTQALADAHVLHVAAIRRARESGAHVLHVPYASVLLQELCVRLDERTVDLVTGMAARMRLAYRDALDVLAGTRAADEMSTIREAWWLPAALQGRTERAEVALETSLARAPPAMRRADDPTDEDSIARVYIEHLVLHPVALRLSFKTSTGAPPGEAEREADDRVAVLDALARSAGATIGSIEGVSLSLNALLAEHVFEEPRALRERVVRHYRSQVLLEAYKALGSFEFMGDPAGLVVSLGTGVVDFFYEPARGMVERPEDFHVHVAKGSASLVANTFGAASRSVSQVTRSLSRGLAGLALDDEYERAEEIRRTESPRDFGEGVGQGALALGRGIIGGISGLFTKPVEEANREGAVGFVRGVGKGVLGLAVKPAAGALSFAAQTTEGLTATTDALTDAAVPSRARLPRTFGRRGELVPYDRKEAEGQFLLSRLENGEYAGESYADHISLRKHVLLTSTKHVFLVEPSSFECVWAELLEDILGVETTKESVIIRLQREEDAGDIVSFFRNVFDTGKREQRIVRCPDSLARDVAAALVRTAIPH